MLRKIWQELGFWLNILILAMFCAESLMIATGYLHH